MSLPVHPRHVMDDRIDLGDEPQQFGSEMCKRPSLRMIGQYVLLAVSCWGKSPRRVTPLTHWVGVGLEGWAWAGSRGIQQILLIGTGAAYGPQQDGRRAKSTSAVMVSRHPRFTGERLTFWRIHKMREVHQDKPIIV